MIEEIRIRDLGVIAEASLPLGPGFTVVTGETGAGKTMVVTALGLLLGARADSGTVRLGAKAAAAEATVLLGAGHAALSRAEEAGAQLEEGPEDAEQSAATELLISRTVAADGRSRAFLGGRSVPAAVLSEVGSELVAVHGQSEQIRLRSSTAQREALDAFAASGTAGSSPRFRDCLAEYRSLYERWRQDSARLRQRQDSGAERQRQAADLEAALAEVERVDPQPGEDVQLKAESLRLTHLEALRLAAGAAHELLIREDFGEAPDATSLVDTARRALDQVSEHDEALGRAAERLTEAGYLLNDIAAELASYQAGLDADAQGRLVVIEDRRGELNKLLRTHGHDTVDALLSWSQDAALILADLQGGTDSIAALEAAVQEAGSQLDALAAQLRQDRKAAAAELSERVTAELTTLAMPQARVQIEVKPSDRGPYGIDDVAFLLQPHPGAALRPVAKGASGGELSRVMLALEVVLAAADPVPTFVFDEVDAGVGGKAAVEIGRRLAALAQHVQVIVVTHLPQVAAFADRHIRVLKTSDAQLTSSDVMALDQEERVAELARMLAGQEDSQRARDHARELLDQAELERSK
ncbi:DNA repair protein RecN [Acaricomes phytoseiuli]|uniref:DNA repair protein RecN n=1 Tax=Acaricomes phytoseiuli TaxID=291968 RepID=UPI0022218813|nr:DNA repair protein RecN [Acaricomes phytoseiuli]MCW1249440.1 DNA repair protein RecN [Acaricomes phytoseiuli]